MLWPAPSMFHRGLTVDERAPVQPAERAASIKHPVLFEYLPDWL